jgi:hypothetical protein
MRVKHLVQKNKMGKNIAASFATSWVPSVFKKRDLEKAQANGLISADDQVISLALSASPSPRAAFG